MRKKKQIRYNDGYLEYFKYSLKMADPSLNSGLVNKEDRITNGKK